MSETIRHSIGVTPAFSWVKKRIPAIAYSRTTLSDLNPCMFGFSLCPFFVQGISHPEMSYHCKDSPSTSFTSPMVDVSHVSAEISSVSFCQQCATGRLPILRCAFLSCCTGTQHITNNTSQTKTNDDQRMSMQCSVVRCGASPWARLRSRQSGDGVRCVFLFT